MAFIDKKYSDARGFTLLELSITMLIIALVLGLSISMGTGVVSAARKAATISKMAAIEKALMAYRSAYDRLPCPASLTIAPGATNFGTEAVNPGACTGGTPAATYTGAQTASVNGVLNTSQYVAEGAVPFATLGLPSDFMFDGWGNRFNYSVDTLYTLANAFSTTGIGYGDGAIQLWRAYCTSSGCASSKATNDAAYVLISHGPNGNCAYNNYGNQTINTSIMDTYEGWNCHYQSGALESPTIPVYAQGTLNNGTALADIQTGVTYYFDDIVDSKSRAQLSLPRDNPRASAQYLAVSTNNSGTYYLYLYEFVGGTLNGTNQAGYLAPAYTNRMAFSYNDSALVFAGNDHTIYYYTVNNPVVGANGMAQEPYLFFNGGSTQGIGNALLMGNYTISSCTTACGPFGYIAAAPTQAASTTFSALSPDRGSRLLAVSAVSPDYIQLYAKKFNQTYNAHTFTAQGTNTVSTGNTNTSTSAKVEWDPDGSTVFYLSATPTPSLFAYTPVGNTLALSTNINLSTYLSGVYSGATTDMSVHPSGKYLVVAGGTSVLLFSLPLTSSPTLLTSFAASAPVASVAWSPDGTRLAIDDQTNGLNVYSFTASSYAFSQATIAAQCGANTSFSKPAWTADSDYVAVASGGTLCLYYLGANNTITSLSTLYNSGASTYATAPVGTIEALAFSHVSAGPTSSP